MNMSIYISTSLLYIHGILKSFGEKKKEKKNHSEELAQIYIFSSYSFVVLSN